MKVKELIEWLQPFDPEMVVVVDGYEGGVKEASYVELETIALNVNEEWYYGPHEVVVESDPYEEYTHAKAIHIV